MEEYVKGCRDFSEQDFYLDHEILLEEEIANFYVVMVHSEEIFGIELEEGDWINVYADISLSDGHIKDDLMLTWYHAEEETPVLYRMTETEKDLMQLAAMKYMKAKGVMLPGMRQSFSIEYGPEYGKLCIGSECGSGCRYQEIYSTSGLKQCISEYIDQYVNNNN